MAQRYSAKPRRCRPRKRSWHSKGFSLVSVTLIGLLMLIVVMMMIFRGQSDQAIARAQLLKSQSLSLADAAAVTYQSFLVRYPDLASFGDDNWANFASSVSSDCTLASVFKPEDLQQINTVAQVGTAWQNIDPQDLTQGQFRLVDYTYTPDPGIASNQAPGTGRLRIEGRARAKGLATEAFGFGSSRSQVELQFRVEAKPPESLPVGLVGNGFTASSNAYGAPQISSNICDSSATKSSSSLTAYMTNLPNGDPSKIAYSTTFVTAPPSDGASPMTGAGVYDLGSFSVGSNQTCQLPILGTTSTSEGLPQNCSILLTEMGTTDAQGHPVYKYNLSDLVLGTDTVVSGVAGSTVQNSTVGSSTPTMTTTSSGNARLILGRTGNEVIHLYVASNITLKQSRISVTPGTRVYLYLHGSLDATDPVPEGFFENAQSAENLQVYVYPPDAGGTSTFNLNYGHATSKAFIYAPQANVSLIDVKVDGALWAGTLSIVGDSGVTQNVQDPNKLKILIPGQKRIAPAFSWQQRAAS